MKLYLVQHGDALAEEVDKERPLSGRGRRDLEAVSNLLRTAGIRVRHLFHSGKTRAQQSARILAAAVASGVSPQTLEGILPKDDPRPFLETLGEWERDSMVVGHLPFMARAACMLITGRDDQPFVDFKPGSLVCLERAADGHWRLCWMIRPELLQ